MTTTAPTAQRPSLAWALAGALAGALAISCSDASTTPADAASDVSANSDASGDAGGSADAGDSATLPVPEQLDQGGKVALWLEAAPAQLTVVNGGVTIWYDKSQNHNDATGLAPLPVVESGAQAGHDAVHFGALMSALQIADAPSLQFATGEVYIVAVTKVNVLRMFWFEKVALDDAGSTLTGIEFFDANGGAADGGGQILSPYGEVDNLGGNSISWGTGELDDGKFHLVAFRRTSATAIEVGVDDVAPRSHAVASVDVSAPGQPVYLGAPPQSPGPGIPDMSIAEELVLHDASGVVADTDVAALHAYLKQKYGL